MFYKIDISMLVLRCQWFCNYYNIHTCIIHNIVIDFKHSITFKQSQVWPYRFQKHERTCTYSKQGFWLAGKTKGMVNDTTMPVSLKTIGSAHVIGTNEIRGLEGYWSIEKHSHWWYTVYSIIHFYTHFYKLNEQLICQTWGIHDLYM